MTSLNLPEIKTHSRVSGSSGPAFHGKYLRHPKLFVSDDKGSCCGHEVADKLAVLRSTVLVPDIYDHFSGSRFETITFLFRGISGDPSGVLAELVAVIGAHGNAHASDWPII